MAGPTRWPYGQGIGFVNQFNSYGGPSGGVGSLSTAGLFTQSDTTPDVSIGDLFVANNTGATVITYFDLINYGVKQAEYSGKLIRVMVLDQGSTSFANAGQMFLKGTDNLATNANTPFAIYEFVQFNSSWYQYSDSRVNRGEVSTALLTTASSYNVDGVKVLLLNNTGSVTRPISAFSGGQVGQVIQVSQVGSNAVRFLASATLILAATNSFVMNASGLYQFVKTTGTEWRLLTATTLGVS